MAVAAVQYRMALIGAMIGALIGAMVGAIIEAIIRAIIGIKCCQRLWANELNTIKVAFWP